MKRIKFEEALATPVSLNMLCTNLLCNQCAGTDSFYGEFSCVSAGACLANTLFGLLRPC